MLVSLDWLKEYTTIDEPLNTLIERMNLTGSKVENIDIKGNGLENIVIAKILKIEKHPNADKLSVCTLDIGNGIQKIIITGAKNIREGDNIPLALPGSVLQGKEIQKTNFRGIESNGMMCSGEELGLDASVLPKHSEGGIYIFAENLTPGDDALLHLGLRDTVIDFEITNNRPDCQSMIGMAREFAAAFYRPVNIPDAKLSETKEDIGNYLSIEIADTDLCHRYVARMLKVKKIEPSPLWMQRRLMACGMRPINNIVDVTNYVLLEVGQPLHAFDYKMIENKKIIVRRAKENEKIITLDGKERAACNDLLLIADTKKGVGIAGIMGGQNSEITGSTEMIVLESAAFNANNIRKSANKMGMNTDASALFAKGVNPALSDYAANRATEILINIEAAELIEGIIDIYPKPVMPKTISVDSKWVNKFLGMNIPLKDMIRSLKSLGMTCDVINKIIQVTSPVYRTDINIKEDIAEEIVRIYGYEKIPSTLNNASIFVSPKNEKFELKTNIRYLMASIGAYEALTYTFTSYQNIVKLNSELNKTDLVRILNPLGENTAYMRVSIVGSLLEVVALNLARNNNKGIFFEIGNIFYNKKDREGLPTQLEKLALVAYGGYDYFYVKGYVEILFKMLGINNAKYTRSKNSFLHPGKSADIYINDILIGYIGQIHPSVAKSFETEQNTIAFELDINTLFKLSNKDFVYKSIPKYPSITRDMAIIVREDILSADILSAINNSETTLLEDVNLFDVFEGKQIPQGYKSLAYSLQFRSNERTLVDAEVDRIFDSILDNLENKFDAKLR
jgi:phenylalanyl-tRNA synthetase beta chain